MQTSKVFFLFLLFIIGLVVACGPSDEDLNARTTQEAAEIASTQAAAAPTATNTPLPEPTVTNTSSPEPTETPSPEPTETPSPTTTNAPTSTLLPTNTPEPTATPKPDLVVIAESINLRSGPGTAYEILDSIGEGEELAVVGQAFDCQWLMVEWGDIGEGWVSGDSAYVTLSSACEAIPESDIPPMPVAPVPPTQDTSQAACGWTASIVGRWLHNLGWVDAEGNSGDSSQFIFLADGTLIKESYDQGNLIKTHTGNWACVNGLLVGVLNSEVEVAISGNTLTLTVPGTIIYIKLNRI